MNNIKNSLDLQRLAKQQHIFNKVLPEKFPNKWKKTGYFVQDLISSAVSFYRSKNRPLKTIYLRPSLFEQYKLWVSKNTPINVEENDLMFDGVNIDKGSKLQLETAYFEFYEQVPTGQGTA